MELELKAVLEDDSQYSQVQVSAEALITVKHDAALQDKIPTCQQKDLESACFVDSEAFL